MEIVKTTTEMHKSNSTKLINCTNYCLIKDYRVEIQFLLAFFCDVIEIHLKKEKTFPQLKLSSSHLPDTPS